MKGKQGGGWEGVNVLEGRERREEGCSGLGGFWAWGNRGEDD